MNYAHLYNYLGIPEISGTEFQRVAHGQVAGFGAKLVEEEVTSITVGEGVIVETPAGQFTSDYVILTEGKNPELGHSLGLETDDGGAIVVDRDNRSSLDRV